MNKKCFRCGIVKEITEFYPHKKMKDGHLNKCKECTKKDSSKRELKIRSTEEGVESERRRHREKYHRLGYKEKQKEWDKNKPWKQTSIYKDLKRNLNKKYPHYKQYEIHHWNYNKLKSIFLLSPSFHKKIHRKLELDYETLCFIHEGILLDSKILHEKFLNFWAEKLQEKIISIEYQ